jgi:hypothetical protein
MKYLHNTATNESGIDGLIVVSDSQTITSHYICKSTSCRKKTLRNMINIPHLLEMENILRREIFANGIEKDKIKVSCAACLLSSVPNGVACIISSNKYSIEKVIDNAEQKKNEKKELHHDHACFLYPMTFAELRNVEHWHPTFFNNLVKEKDFYVKDWAHNWKEGPHLLEMMDLLWKNDRRLVNSTHCVMIMFAYEQVKGENINYWTLDIPGGKRYLGETALKCAIRETEEETSVNILKKWCIANHCTDVNCYYVFNPNVA